MQAMNRTVLDPVEPAVPDHVMADAHPTERFDVVVIGGGQAVLAAGYYLQANRHEFVILDAEARIGDAWRKR